MRTTAEAEIEALDNQRIAATLSGDVAALECLYADDLIYTHSGGTTDTKAVILANTARRASWFVAINAMDRTIRVYGDAAVLTGKYQIVFTERGKKGEWGVTSVSVWIKASNEWRMVTMQTTRVSMAA